MTTFEDVLKIACSELGVEENSEGSNLTKYGRWYGMDGEPWCAMFVSYCFNFAGLPLSSTTPKGFAYCPFGVEFFKAKNQFYQTPKVGDVVFFDWPNQGESRAEHVGIVEKVISDRHIISIEGNTSTSDNTNGGEVMRQERRGDCIVGYGRPKYDDVSVFEGIDPPSWPGKYITLTSPNARGEDVRAWQTRMIQMGWELGSGGPSGKGDDGVFGEACYQALRRFQTEEKLEVDGKLGPASWYHLWRRDVVNRLAGSDSNQLGTPVAPDRVPTVTSPDGKVHPQGMWIWELKRLRNEYLDALVAAKCKRVYLKVLDDASSGIFWANQCIAEVISSFTQRGIEVWGWGYIFDGRTTTDTQGIIKALRKAFEAGITGFVFDVEKEVEGQSTHAQLREILSMARHVIPDGCMGYTSFGKPKSHPNVPWQMLNQLCDLQFPQIYYELFTFGPGDPGEAENRCEVETCLQEHRELGLNKPILPIWSSETGAPHPTSREELQRYLNEYPGSSIWRAPALGESGHAWNCFYDGKPMVDDTPPTISDILYKAKVIDPEPPLNVRAGSGTGFPVVQKLDRGTIVAVTQENNMGWVQIVEPVEEWAAKHLIEREQSTNNQQRRILHLVPMGRRDEYGLEMLYLSIHNGDFNPIDSIGVTSGQPHGCQKFELGSPSNVAGCNYPLPQGDYKVGRVAWASGINNYQASFGSGFGPVWVDIKPTFNTGRSGFGFHQDYNFPNSPGSAGCVVFRTTADLKKFVSWFKDSELAPNRLVVDWKLRSAVNAEEREAVAAGR